MSVPCWVGRYIGIPFEKSGFDEAGCHCWGLVRLVYLRECGIELPRYGELSADDLAAAARTFGPEAKAGPWQKVAGERRPYDVLLMSGRLEQAGRPARVPLHAGVMVASNLVLHVQEAVAAVCVPLSHRSIRFRMLDTYRHEALA